MATTRTVNINLKDILGDAASSAVCVFSPITSNLASSVDVAIGAPARVVMASDGTAQTSLVVPSSDAYKYECLIRDANDYTANRFQFTLGTGDPTTLAAIMADSNVAGTTTNTSLETALQAVLPTTTISTINVVDLNVSGTATFATVNYDATQNITIGGTMTALEFRDTDNTATGIKAEALGGSANVASANYSSAKGLQAKAELLGASAHASGQFSAAGDAQSITLVARRSITGASAQDLYLDGSSARLTIPTNTVWSILTQVVAVVDESGTGGPTQGACCSHLIHGILSNVGGTVTLVGQTEIDKVPGGATGSATLIGDNTNKALRINFDPPNQAAADTVMRVVATVQITQAGF